MDTNPSTNLVSGISQPGVSFSYGYAGNTDNIVSEVRSGGSYAGTTTYEYDSLGQLTRVNDPVENATWIYNYDRGGNMVSKVKYAYTTGGLGAAQQSIGYAYGDANWKDKLTAYNGVGITYDAIGNVTGDGTWTYVWEGGRQLKGMSYSGASVTYDYDHNGQRVRKVVNGVETKYWVNGAKVVHVVRGSDWLHVYYDGQGRPGITNYNGAIYYYLYNLQGDVIGLVDGSGNVVVEYKYDAWGKVIGKTGSLASTLGYLNPFRYRGYVYDEETGLYYLRSRYYNPGWGRFINADVVMGQVGGLLSHNVFAYCGNNPIALEDPDGDVALAILGYEAVGGLAAFVSAVTWMSSREHWDDFAIRNPMPKMSLDPWDASRSWIVSAELAVFAQLAGFDNKRKPINLPSSRRITLNMDHIMSGHGSGGKRGGPNKDRFPEWVTVQIAERIIRTAYKYGERVSTQGDRVFVRGPWDPGRIIEMWVNIVEKVIESAWPKY